MAARGAALFLAAARLGDHFGAFLSETVFGALALLAFGRIVAFPATCLTAGGLAIFAEVGFGDFAAAGLVPFYGAAFDLAFAGGAPLTGKDNFFKLKA